jgi:BirA family biotin operon repressor/biotin-[acetyl-CoA-carboxylase] ligase
MASLAVRDALIESCDLYTDIKWPNDLLAKGSKLSGILAEVLETSIGRAVVVGVGINLTNQSLSEELHGFATSVETATGKIPDSEHVLQAVISRLAHRYGALQAEDGAATTVAEWSRASSFAEDKKIRVNSGEEVWEGTTCGLEPDGALRIETAPGQIRVIRAGDVFELRDRGASI